MTLNAGRSSSASDVAVTPVLTVWSRNAIVSDAATGNRVTKANMEIRTSERVGRKEVFYLTTYSIHFTDSYMIKDQTDSEIENTLPPHEILFPIRSKGSFICIIPQTG